MTKGAIEDLNAYNEFKKLINNFKIKKIIETGTYYGWSSIKLSEFGLPVKTIEFSTQNYNIAKNNIEEKKLHNVEVILGSSPNILNEILNDNEKDLLLFLDAHWGNYWPIHDELKVCIEKKIKPVIVIHDFYVPDNNGKAKFGYDSYNGQNLDYKYIEKFLITIYGENGFSYHYTDKIESVDSGLIYIYPKNENT